MKLWLITCLLLKTALDLVKYMYSYTEIWIFIKYVTGPWFLPSFDKMQNHNAQKSIHASLKWYDKEVTGLFYPLKVLCNTSIVSTINWVSSFFFYFSYCISMSFIWVIFSKMKEIMNVNRRIILVLKKNYDKIDDHGHYYAPFYLITDPDLCERCYLHDFTHLTGF